MGSQPNENANGPACDEAERTVQSFGVNDADTSSVAGNRSISQAQTALQCEAVARAGLGEPLKRSGNELLYRCVNAANHRRGDANPSLKINLAKNVWACFPCSEGGTAWQLAAFLARVDAGDKQAVAAWLRERGLINGQPSAGASGENSGKIVAAYDYTDENGALLFQVCRTEPKGFFQRRLDHQGEWINRLGNTRRVLYRLPEVIKAESVIICEGEKDVEAARRLGLTATCNPHGAGRWRPEYSESLRGKKVAIIADADEPGRKHAQAVAASLLGVAASVKAPLELPGAKDLSEWLDLGEGQDIEGAKEQLLGLIENAPELTGPKPAPSNGAEILDSLVRLIRRFVSLSEAQARVVTLWVAHTHAITAADCTPYLNIHSAEAQSGKTRLLEVLRLLVCKPWFTGRTTTAALVRKIHAESPALLLDESDAAFRGEQEYAETLRGVLNSGYRRGGSYSACVGQGANIGYQNFSTFSPKAIAGIGRLPDTVEDRSIPIRLTRARRGAVERFRERDVSVEAGKLQAKIGAWCSGKLGALRDARPAIPNSLSDRQADCCEPLLAIADLAGETWPELARRAITELCANARADDGSIGVQLLSDIRRILCPQDDSGNAAPVVDRISSADLATALGAIEGSPWPEWGRTQRPITPNQIARLLSRYDINPRTIRFPDERTIRGYLQESFLEAWATYLPPATAPNSPVPPLYNRNTATTRINIGPNEDFKPQHDFPCCVSKNAVSTNKDAPCGGVAVQNPEYEAGRARNELSQDEDIPDLAGGAPDQANPSPEAEAAIQRAGALDPQPDDRPMPEECHSRKGRWWWTSKLGVRLCVRCHPPAPSAISDKPGIASFVLYPGKGLPDDVEQSILGWIARSDGGGMKLTDSEISQVRP